MTGGFDDADGVTDAPGRRHVPLAELLHSGRPLNPVDVARVGAEVAAALADRHTAGRTHGAVDADHVTIAPADDRGIGLVLLLDPLPAATPASVDRALDEPATPARDVRDLGVLLGTALTGHRPPPGGAVPVAVGSAWQQVLRSMNAVSPVDRPTAAWVRDTLAEPARRVSKSPDAAPDVPAPPPPRSKLLPRGERTTTTPVNVPAPGRWRRLRGLRPTAPSDRDTRDVPPG